PAPKREALSYIRMGAVIRITLVFRERFWNRIEPQAGRTLEGLSFLLSPDDLFPTWWTTMPEKQPIITGWSPASHADRLSGRDVAYVTTKAVDTLARLLQVSKKDVEGRLVAAHTHDWQSDPFSLGAYSYVKVGGADAPRQLGQPIDNTLFFAGEATDLSGHTGTVH